MPPIRAITLDLDDTLWAIGPVIRRAEAELWAWLTEHYPRIGESFSPQAVSELRAEVLRQHADQSHDLRFLRQRVLMLMAEQAGYSSDLADRAFAIFDAARNRVDLFPDVQPALRSLRERFTIVAVTNGNACLERIGIRHLFNDIVTAADVGAAKPARSIFATAVRRAGVAAQDVLHVGDHPEADVAGAADAGLRTAWVNRADAEWPGHLPPPDVTVTSLDELRQRLDGLASAS